MTLVQTAKDQNFIYKGTYNGIINADILGINKEWKLLRVFEFNSDRKKMTIIVQDGNLIKMYTKGADSSIKKNLYNSNSIEQPFLAYNEKKVKYFSNMGLRTLLYAMKIMDPQEYAEMDKRLNELVGADNREEKICIIDLVFMD